MLRFLARVVGLWLLAGALVALVVDGAKTIAASSPVTTPLGELWYAVDPASLDGARAAIQRYAPAVLWDPVIQSVLLAPSFVVLGIAGTLLVVLGRKKRLPELSELELD